MIIATKKDDRLYDLQENVDGKGVDINSKEGLQIVRHSAAHILAQAIQRLYPGAKKAIGPDTKDGFFYDMDYSKSFTEDDLVKIEEEMNKIVSEKLEIKREVISKKDAIKLFKGLGEDYKVEILDRIEDSNVTIFRQGEYVDLCRGPHIPNTSLLKAFKLRDISGAYWKNDSNNKMLQRVYGYCFSDRKSLKSHLIFLEEVAKRDHRKLGRSLELIMTDAAAVGSTFWLPNGVVLRNIVEEFSRQEHLKEGYEEIKTPTILSRDLWEKSGHWGNYRENMYSTEFENETLLVKPMNCPGSVLVYKNSPKSYRDFPLKLLEFGNVFRRELSGAIHGLMRQREFTQDDAHIYLTEDMIEGEICKVISLVDRILSKFGFKYRVELSTRPDKFVGKEENWDRATEALKAALNKSGIDYKINEGDGAFYGPKIDYKVEDAIGREWQCSTIQLDFNLPERFDISYINSDGESVRPIMIHRAIYGSLERFIGILIEHYSGVFPLWLAPVQVEIMTVSEKSEEYAKEVYKALGDYRVKLNSSNYRIGQKIKISSLKKVPFQVVIGENEIESNTLNIRTFGSKDQKSLTLEDFKNLLNKSLC